MSDIEDLCAIIHRGIGLNFEDLADEIIAAGFHRDRTITTAEELDRLGYDVILRDNEGIACQVRNGYIWRMGEDMDFPVSEAGTFGPFTVLHEGARDE